MKRTKEKMVMLFTHNDLDGVSPVILFLIAVQLHLFKFAYKCLNYDRIDREILNFLKENPDTDIDIYITDISVNDEVAELLNERVKAGQKVVLIDHHPTAITLSEKYEWAMVKPTYEDGRKTAATSLLYEYLTKEDLLNHENVLSDYVELVRSYDTWDWSKTNNMRAKHLNDILYIVGIQKFIEQTFHKLDYVTNVENISYREYNIFSFTKEENALLESEQYRIKTYIDKKEKQMKRTKMHYPFLGDYKVGLLFAELYQSELGNELCLRNEDLDYVVMIDAGKEKISFRATKSLIDVSKVASIYGGGGHPPAAGCQFNDKSIYELVMKALEFQIG